MFTTPPTFRLPRSVFFVVSSIISKIHLDFDSFVAVRHTPFSATLCPIFNPFTCLPKSIVISIALRFFVIFEILFTFPTPSTIPVNIKKNTLSLYKMI